MNKDASGLAKTEHFRMIKLVTDKELFLCLRPNTSRELHFGAVHFSTINALATY